MKQLNKNILKLLFVLSLLVSFGIADEISVSANVNSTNITLNDVFSYTIVVQGTRKISQVPKPEGKNFTIINGPSRSSNIQIINGKMEAKNSFTWQLQPYKEGELIINGFSIMLKKKKYSADRIIVNVGKPRYSSGNNKSKNQNEQIASGGQIFLDAVASKQSAYLGEQVIVEYKLIYNMRITNYGTEKLPQAKGFWIEEFPEIRNPQSSKIIIDGVEYMSATIKRIALFPTTTGKLEIDPMITQCEVVLPQKKKKTSNSRFDSFFDDPFFGNSIFDRTSVKRVASQPLTIEVKSLPEYTSSDTIPSVMEKISISGSVDTVEILCNKALTLKYNISGYGNINAINLEKPILPDYVEVFPPKVNKVTSNKNAKIQGVASYEYILIPHKPGKLIIPPVKMTYFNPKIAKYKTVQSKAFEITVLEDKNQITINSGLNKEEIQMLDQDIRYIMKDEAKWFNKTLQFYQNKNIIMINLFSIIFLLAGMSYKVYRKTIGSNPILMRKTKAYKKALEKLNESQNLWKNKNFTEALPGFDSVITGFISDRLNLPEAGFGPLDFRNELNKLNIDENTTNESFQFLESMELYRYSPGSMNPADNHNLPEKCKTLLMQLSKVI